MALQLKLSCDNDKKDSGPTLIHSTGVEHYKISPDIIRILQEALTNDNLSDHDDGVLCQATPQHILDLLSQNGFSVQDENDEDDKTTWTVTQGDASGGDGSEERAHPSDGNEAEGDGDGGAGGGGGGDEEQAGDEDGGEQQQEDEEQEKEE